MWVFKVIIEWLDSIINMLLCTSELVSAGVSFPFLLFVYVHTNFLDVSSAALRHVFHLADHISWLELCSIDALMFVSTSMALVLAWLLIA